MIAYTLIILSAWIGSILLTFGLCVGANDSIEDARDRRNMDDATKNQHFLRG